MAEAALVTAEKWAAIGSVGWAAPYPKADLTKAWEKVLFLQFHDSLAGTALPEHYVMARDAHGRAMDAAHDAMYTALQRLAWQIPTVDPDSKYFVVFNPHAWSMKANVEYDFGWDRSTPGYVQDDSGRDLPSQWIDATTVTTTAWIRDAGRCACVWVSSDTNSKRHASRATRGEPPRVLADHGKRPCSA